MVKKPELADFCPIDSVVENRLSALERLTLTGGEELTRALSLLSSKLEGLDQLIHAEISVDPVVPSFSPFRLSKEPPHATVTLVHSIFQGKVIDLTFPTRFVPTATPPPQPFSSCLKGSCGTVYARWWRHDHKPRAQVLAIHGWTMGDQRVNSLAFLPGVLFQQGYDVVLIELPFHGRRRNRESNLRTVLDTHQAVLQAVDDCDALLSLLKAERRVPQVWLGLSLGALVGRILASQRSMAGAVALVPIFDLASVFKRLLKPDAKDRKILEQLFSSAPFSPKKLKIPSARTMVVAGYRDPFCTTDAVRAFAALAQQSQIHFFRGGHAAHVRSKRAFNSIVKFLNTAFPRQ